MSRSRLKDRWKRKQAYEQCAYVLDVGERNPHCLDEMPKNHPSKFILAHCKNDIGWLQEPGYCQGHKTHRGAHRMISGIVRAKLNEETRMEVKWIEQRLF